MTLKHLKEFQYFDYKNGIWEGNGYQDKKSFNTMLKHIMNHYKDLEIDYIEKTQDYEKLITFTNGKQVLIQFDVNKYETVSTDAN